MKTIRLKLLLPVVAFMFAIVAAFATQKEVREGFAPVQGYIFQNDVCVPHGKCSNEGFQVCSDTSGRQVFGKIDGTGCEYPLYMNWKP